MATSTTKLTLFHSIFLTRLTRFALASLTGVRRLRRDGKNKCNAFEVDPLCRVQDDDHRSQLLRSGRCEHHGANNGASGRARQAQQDPELQLASFWAEKADGHG